jgi:hypothetical protein
VLAACRLRRLSSGFASPHPCDLWAKVNNDRSMYCIVVLAAGAQEPHTIVTVSLEILVSCRTSRLVLGSIAKSAHWSNCGEALLLALTSYSNGMVEPLLMVIASWQRQPFNGRDLELNKCPELRKQPSALSAHQLLTQRAGIYFHANDPRCGSHSQ